jgi:XTP/dITP diphosphohydrolase
MNKIVFATNNQNKLKEIRSAFSSDEVLSLYDIGFSGDIPETQETLEGNALQKANYIFERYGLPVFSDDTGLEVEALNGAPGVYSARYAGEQCNSEDNMKKLLNGLEGSGDRSAKFRTVIAFVDGDKEYIFEGEVVGEILKEKSGQEGFGYDPIFQPEGFNLSFAEMSLEEKNKISHRGTAVRKFVEFLESYKI